MVFIAAGACGSYNNPHRMAEVMAKGEELEVARERIDLIPRGKAPAISLIKNYFISMS